MPSSSPRTRQRRRVGPGGREPRAAPLRPAWDVSVRGVPHTWRVGAVLGDVQRGILLALPFTTLGLATLGLVWGGVWSVAVPIQIFVLLPLADAWVGPVRSDEEVPSGAPRWLEHLPAVAVLYQVALVVAGAYVTTRPGTSPAEALALTLSAGTISGAVGIVAAHELLHRRGRVERALSALSLASVAYLHFMIEHAHHHAWAATPKDAAFVGRDTVYRFLFRTIPAQFVRCLRAEATRLGRQGRGPWVPENRMWWVVATPLAVAGALGLLWGAGAALFFAGQAFVAVVLLEIVNYVEHYGLQRGLLASGRYEPVTVAHAWDTRRQLSNYFVFQLERHAHHHANATIPFPQLRFEPAAPQLPAGYSAMILISLVPPLWRAVMDRRLPAAMLPELPETRGHA